MVNAPESDSIDPDFPDSKGIHIVDSCPMMISTERSSKRNFLKKSVECKSFDSSVLQTSEPSPTATKPEVYSYGRRDSLNRTKFLLVRTSCSQNKESFKRVTLPGGATVHFLKSTIEKAMKRGRVSKVLLLPNKVSIENNEQISNIKDSQKVEVIFENYEWLQKVYPSPTEKTFSENSYNGKVGRWNSDASNDLNPSKTVSDSNQEIKKDKKSEGSSDNEKDFEEMTVNPSLCLPSSTEFTNFTVKVPVVYHQTESVLTHHSVTSNRTDKCTAAETSANFASEAPILRVATDFGQNYDNSFSIRNKVLFVNEKAAKVLGLFRLKSTNCVTLKEDKTFTVPQLILIVAGIGGVVGIGYYFYSRCK